MADSLQELVEAHRIAVRDRKAASVRVSELHSRIVGTRGWQEFCRLHWSNFFNTYIFGDEEDYKMEESKPISSPKRDDRVIGGGWDESAYDSGGRRNG
jgi:hypothetical protein